MRQVIFAVGYMPHRLWGNVLQAQILEKEDGKEFFFPREFVQNDEQTEAFKRLSPMQKEVVYLLDEYSDRKLHKIFSRKKTVKEFQDSVDGNTIKEHIRPFIERYLGKALEIVRDNRVPVFVKDKGTRNIFPEDFIRIERQAAEPVFEFSYDQHLSYCLRIKHPSGDVVLQRDYAEIISVEPAILLLANTVYFIRDIDGRKLLPFLKKDRMLIPGEMEAKYFASFVRNSIRDYTTQLKGIPVIRKVPGTEARLVLEQSVSGGAHWMLSFSYDDQIIHASSSITRFVSYTGTAGHPAFELAERDSGWETECLSVLGEAGLRTRDDRNFYLKEGSLYDAVEFMNENGRLMEEAGLVIGQNLELRYYLGPVELTLESSEKEDWFDVRALVSFGDHKVSFLLLKDHILDGRREYELPDGSIAILPDEWIARYRSMFEFGKFRGEGILIHKQHFSQMDGSVRALHSATMKKLDKLNEVESMKAMELPLGLQAEMRPYQAEGYTWLNFLKKFGFGACLADDMGLGKTLQAIALLQGSREEQEKSKDASEPDAPAGQLSMIGLERRKKTSLVVVPASLLHNWLSELGKFAPGLKVCIHSGPARNRELSNFPYYDVVLSSYHTVRQDVDAMARYLFHYIILDESQMIKNPSSKLYQAITDLLAEHRVVLTGTPIENSLLDLWSQINFLNPGLLGNLSFFKRSFVLAIEKKKDEAREEKLKELIRPFILRRTKEEVARDLPPVSEQVRICNMTEDQRRVYEEEKSQARNSILENLEEIGMERSSLLVLRALTRLRQIANHPRMLEDEDMEGMDSGKFQEVCRNASNVIMEGHKVLLFSSFVKHLELFRQYFDGQGIAYAYLTGSRNQNQRKEAVKSFQKKGNCPVFLISLKAGGVGLNLTAADYVFILDPWWNPAAEMQALNRAHRIGQDKSVFVYRFISANSIEEKIHRLQQRKLDLAESLVSSNNPLKGLNEKEILDLFT